MNKYLKESVIWTIMAMPFVYLSTVWSRLPEQVPTHFGIDGVANGWMSKPVFLCFVVGLIVGLYLLFLVMPKLDTKKKIEQMGEKYYHLRVTFAVFFSLISCVNIYFAVQGSLDKPQILVALLGVLYTIIGNYSQAIRPNYFLGFRTPWTLESEAVWKSTHLLGGRTWVIGGIITILWSLLINNNQVLFIGLMVILAFLVIIPTAYSYLLYKKEK
jgi:uncharacterized membrane protein